MRRDITAFRVCSWGISFLIILILLSAAVAILEPEYLDYTPPDLLGINGTDEGCYLMYGPLMQQHLLWEGYPPVVIAWCKASQCCMDTFLVSGYTRGCHTDDLGDKQLAYHASEDCRSL